VLEVKDLVVRYGAVRALNGVSLSVADGQAVCVIGSNGAGKSTLLRTISGFIRPVEGDIRLNGQSIVGEAPHRIARLRVAHVPEGRHVFPDQTVIDNLQLGAFSRPRSQRAEVEADSAYVFDLFPRLAERRQQLAGTLSGGEQQMLAIGRALMLRPQVLMLDEPSMGLAPVLIDEVFRRLSELKKRGMTMLLVEQLAYRALEIADVGYVLEHGRVEVSGPAQELARDSRVQAAYLGQSAASGGA
jgi:branched-chain amino acid transport system ATP-binding protein